MSHPPFSDLSEFVRGEGEPARAAAVREHLAACPACRSRRDAVAAMERALRAIPADSPSAAFTPRLLSRLGLAGGAGAGRTEALPLGWLFLRNFIPIAAAGLIAAVVMTLGEGERSAVPGVPPPGGYGAGPAAGAVRDFAGSLADRLSAAVSGVLAADGAMDALSVLTMLTVLLGSVGLFDRFVLGPRMRRRH